MTPEKWTPTCRLRFRQDTRGLILQQYFKCPDGDAAMWIDVPLVPWAGNYDYE
jgi:hypothetical protein